MVDNLLSGMMGLFNLRQQQIPDVPQNILQLSLEQDKSLYKNILSEEGETQLKDIIYDVSNNTDEKRNSTCPITMEEFKNGDSVTQLPCGHLFDKDGIRHWLKNENACCPICRFELKNKEVKRKVSETNSSTEEVSNVTTPLITRFSTPIIYRNNDISSNMDIIRQHLFQPNSEISRRALHNMFFSTPYTPNHFYINTNNEVIETVDSSNNIITPLSSVSSEDINEDFSITNLNADEKMMQYVIEQSIKTQTKSDWDSEDDGSAE